MRWLRRSARGFLYAASVAAVACCWIVVGFELAVRSGDYPTEDLEREVTASIRIVDRDGRPLREVVNRQGQRSIWTPLARINPLVARATIAVEDHRFYDHHGVDELGVFRAGLQNLRAGRSVSGASTLTMQLARLVHPHERDLGGKLGEAVEARRIERAVSKEIILEQYLNRAPYGAGTIGVEAASRRYFDKPSQHLSLAESALLAGLPKAPSRLNPLRDPEAARERQRHVLDRMLETGAVTRAAYERALREPLRYREDDPTLRAMHFTDYVLSEDPPAGRVETTLDLDLQRQVEGALARHVDSLAAGGVTNAAAVVLDNERCEIRAMVGSVDYWREPSGMVNGALARRQPGSALKPFTYGLAFEEGDTPATVVADVETSYRSPGGGLFTPENFSERFSGPVLMGAALGRSLNVPAIRIAQRVGAEALLDRLRRAGFDSLDRPASHYGLGLTLGNGEVTLLELARAYASLARGGLGCSPVAYDGQEVAAPERVFSEEVAFLLTEVLSDPGLRIDAFGPANALLLGFPVAVKTGTSQNWRDTWAIGYTDRYTVAVWSGDFEGRALNHLAGATGAGPLFHTLMCLVVDRGGEAPEPPAPPPGIASVEVCALSGRLPGPDCPHRRTLHVRREHRPTETCSWHRRIALDRRNGLRAGPHCPEQHTERRVFEVLPPEYAEWVADGGGRRPPVKYSPECPAEGPASGAIAIEAPRDGEVFVIEPGYDRATQTVELSAAPSAPVEQVVWRVDGRRIARAGWPYRAQWRLAPGRHAITVEAPGLTGDEIELEVR